MMLEGALRKPFPEQVAAFRLRLSDLRPTAKWDDLIRTQHDRAFMVAGAIKADLLADLARAVDLAISEGRGIEAFRADFRQIVEKHGWHGWTGEGSKRGEAWRTRVIYRTNMRTSYAAGRWAQIIQGGFPLVVYRHGGSREPRLEHLGWDGLVLPVDHPFWASHAPPNGWGCSCAVYGARNEKRARALGGDLSKGLPEGWDARSPKTGAPEGIDKGWDYAPGASVADMVGALGAKIANLPAPIGADFVKSWPEAAFKGLAARFAEFVETSLSTHKQEKFMIIGAVQPEWIRAAAKEGVRIESAEIAIVDRGVQHFFRGTEHARVSSRADGIRKAKVAPLDLEWFKNLPLHLRNPKAVLLDRRDKQPKLLLIYETNETRSKIVITMDMKLKKAKDLMNAVTSGRIVTDRDIQADLGQGVVLILGKI